jgi:hypothetical protein
MATSNPIFGDFYTGIGKSDLHQNGFDSLVGVDIHSEIGKAKSSLAMTKESGTTVTELCKSKAVLPNGDSFWFSSTSGKTWKRTNAGVWSLVSTNANGACLGASYFNGYLYYASAAKLGRIAEGVASSEATWSSHSDSWASFTNGDTSYHPMIEQNLSLFIGDGKYVASVDSGGNFSANALDLQSQHRVTCLKNQGTYLMIGTIASNYINRSGVFLWDTYSSSWTSEGYVREPGIDAFIETDDFVGCIAGTVGNIYSLTFDGANIYFQLYRSLRDNGSSVTTSINQDQTTNLNGLPLIANPRGIFSLGRKSTDFPIALNVEYVPSAGQGITAVGACVAIGTQVLLAWNNSTTYGVDKLDTNRTNGFIITPIAIGNYQRVTVHYYSLPASTSIGISTKVDGGDWTAQTVITDTIKKRAYFDNGLGEVNYLQAKVTLTSSTTTTPTITSIMLE